MKTQSIFEVVVARLGVPAANVLAASLERHYRLWKFQRWSDEATLSVARHILCDMGFAKLCRNPEWIINRGESYMTQFQGSAVSRASRINQLQAGRLKGVDDPYQNLRWMDMGPGNGTTLYECAVPGWEAAGGGYELLYSIEGTLQNCLIPDVQGDAEGSTPSYASKLFRMAARAIEVGSVAELVWMREPSEGWVDACREWDGLDAVATTTSLSHILKGANIDQTALGAPDPARAGTSIVLGLLLDELEGRLQYPNGMNFSFKTLCSVLALAPEALTQAEPAVAGQGFDSAKLSDAAKQLLNTVTERFALDPGSRSSLGDHELRLAESASDAFRDMGFSALEKMDENWRQALFSIANELRRWVFFERDAVRWTSAGQEIDPANILLSWLERPWGIVRSNEMDAAFRDLFDKDDPEGQPRAYFFLADFLRSGVDQALEGMFGAQCDHGTARKLLRKFAQRRMSAAAKRRAVTSVKVDDPKGLQALAAAQTAIQMFGIWAQRNESIMNDLEAHPEKLAAIFRHGSWITSSFVESVLATKTQRNHLRQFSDDPPGFVARLFDFSELEAYPYSVLDCYPPENFLVIEYEREKDDE